ncbi:MAG: class I SAM-dependent methyltransferase, partial [Myxococcota bacterium]
APSARGEDDRVASSSEAADRKDHAPSEDGDRVASSEGADRVDHAPSARGEDDDRVASSSEAADRVPMLVTTAYRPGSILRARAADVASRCGAPFVERASLEQLKQRADCLYIVGRKEEFLYGAAGRFVAGEGLLKLKRLDGLAHPLIRAVAPEDTATRTVFDGTLGGAQDALHLAFMAGLTIDGVDASPALVCLVEDFLRRAADRWGDAAGRVRPKIGDSAQVLRTLPNDAYDVVYFDPMFDRAMPSQPDFQVLRQLAHLAPLSNEMLTEAVRVARQRVVVKVRTSVQPSLVPPAPGWNRRVAARAFNYWIVEKALPDPKLDPLRVKYSHQKLRFLGLM